MQAQAVHTARSAQHHSAPPSTKRAANPDTDCLAAKQHYQMIETRLWLRSQGCVMTGVVGSVRQQHLFCASGCFVSAARACMANTHCMYLNTEHVTPKQNFQTGRKCLQQLVPGLRQAQQRAACVVRRLPSV